MPYILLAVLTILTGSLATGLLVHYVMTSNREVPQRPWFLFWAGLMFPMLIWLILAATAPNIPSETYELGIIEVHGNASSVQYYVGADGKPVSVQEVFKCVLPPGGKIRRVVYRQMYYGVHFMGTELRKDKYEIVDE